MIENRATNESRTIVDLRLPMFGQHNVQNALAAIAVAQEMGLPDETIRRALGGFAGVKRRFTKTGEAHGITVIDDYGHHPGRDRRRRCAPRARPMAARAG